MGMTWSNEEIEYLKDGAGFVKVSTIAKNLGRSYQSVNLKMKRLNVYNTKTQTGMLTMHELATIIGVDRKTVEGWVIRHGLKCKKRVTKEERTFFLISPEDFWEWAEDHKEKVQFTDIEPHILAPEPLWVNQERRNEMDQSLKKKKKYQAWTTKADKELINLRKEGLTYKKIGEIMNRSAVSVERRYKRIHTK
ncbi:sigma-70 RNA polymerase sigma factor region 4 domain-containing protein [Oceanobacillus salinisoli]|uniref:sigma-70 family RNA polymerase sigma factor n=1 Tax=Oceanobacillus salinisoli TaxID=2678611 RepID=UPI0012E27F88|nr:sigma-70 family RNA polymerase sigma factor [Oceanobacillus salinisoli]